MPSKYILLNTTDGNFTHVYTERKAGFLLFSVLLFSLLCLCVCVCVCVHACKRASVRACVRACVHGQVSELYPRETWIV